MRQPQIPNLGPIGQVMDPLQMSPRFVEPAIAYGPTRIPGDPQAGVAYQGLSYAAQEKPAQDWGAALGVLTAIDFLFPS